jgi:hypothetical protein
MISKLFCMEAENINTLDNLSLGNITTPVFGKFPGRLETFFNQHPVTTNFWN